MVVNKDTIRKRFSRAADTYDSQAVIQIKVADRLITLLRQYAGPPPKRLLEIGSCTGLLTSRLALEYTDTTFYVNDLVPEFQTTIASRIRTDADLVFLAGDIESIAIPSDLDLIVSSSTFHWLEDFPAMVDRAYASLSPGGLFAFSMYSTNNLMEFRKITGIGLSYYGMDELDDIISEKFTILAIDDEIIPLWFQDPLELLHHLRETGVNSLDTTQWNRTSLNTFVDQYRKSYSDGNNVVLTYHPVFIVARKEK